MATNLDLEEQEQLDQLKHFWKQYGNLITWLLIAVLGAYAAWNGWNWWQRQQAAKASAIFDAAAEAVQRKDLAALDRSLSDLRSGHGSSAYASQAALLAAKAYQDAGKNTEALAALRWAAEQSGDPGHQAIARLRWASLLADAKSYDEALKVLSGSFPAGFDALASDRRGDVLMLTGKSAEARAEFTKAWQGMDATSDYRRIVEVKLNALGVDPAQSGAAASGTGAKS